MVIVAKASRITWYPCAMRAPDDVEPSGRHGEECKRQKNRATRHDRLVTRVMVQRVKNTASPFRSAQVEEERLGRIEEKSMGEKP